MVIVINVFVRVDAGGEVDPPLHRPPGIRCCTRGVQVALQRRREGSVRLDACHGVEGGLEGKVR